MRKIFWGFVVSTFRHTLVVYCFVFLAVLPAGATTININGLGLWAGGTIGLGNNVVVNAAIASGGEISTGSSVSLRSIYTEDGIWLGNNAIVNGTVLANKQAGAGSGLNLAGSLTGDSISIGSNANITGDIRSNKNVWIGNNLIITGDVSPGSGFSLSKGSNVAITGSTQPASSNFDTFSLPELDQLQQSMVGTDNIYRSRDSTTTLMPDEYRDWSFGRNATLNLSAGQYSLRDFWMDKDSVVNVDISAGDVVLNVVGQFSTGDSVSFLTSGSGSLFINVFNRSVWLEDNVKLSAILKVYGGDFGADKSAQLAGRFYATGDIWLGNNSQLQYVSVQIIPEPSSMVIFAVMGFSYLVKRNN